MPQPTYDVRIDWDNNGTFDSGVPTGAQATGQGASVTPDYLVATDADAADVAIGNKVMIYNSGGVTLKFPKIYTVASKPSAFGFTNIFVTPAMPGATALNDVMKVVTVTGDDVSERRLARSDMTIQYGRDHARSMAPTQPGQAGFELDNASRDYSPENASSPLVGKVLPARPVRIQATHLATTYTLFRGHTDDVSVQPGPGQRSATFGCVDGLAKLAGAEIDTALYQSIRTGDAIDVILDAVDWPALERDIDPGATILPFYWEEGADAWEAIQRLVQSEGMPAFVSIAENGYFVFRDRHHRITRTASNTSQATFRDAGADPRFSWPLNYEHGWRDIINAIRIEIPEREIAPAFSAVWTSERVFRIAASGTLELSVQASDPFIDAITPVLDTDYAVWAGSISNVTLDRTSGQSCTITFTAGAGGASIAHVQLRAHSIPVVRTRILARQDATSKTQYGRRAAEGLAVPLVSYEEASAIAAVILAHRAQRLPVVTIRLTSGNDTITTQQLTRDLSDRVTIVDAETGLNGAFYIETIHHTISGAGSQVFETSLACEKASSASVPLQFRFDTSGQSFNQGAFGT